MVLNIFPRPKAAPAAAPPDVESPPLPEPSSEALEDARKRTRRGSRGGRGRGRAAGVDGANPEDEAPPPAADEASTPAPAPAAPRARSPRSRAAAPAEPALTEEAGPPAAEQPAEDAARPASRRAPRRRDDAAAAEPVDKPEPRPAPRGGRTAPSAAAPATAAPAALAPAPAAASDTAAILRAIEAQGRHLEQIVRAQEDTSRRGGSQHAAAAAPARPQRVGIFVDAANIELACDRLRARFDWVKVLKMLTQDRVLVRAVAYSPVHDDPGVSLETQRFAEPFLGRGYKVVTKALKRFADGSVKANVDIELCLDVVSMLDRLDVVCLVSGDGDFQPLVEHVQRHGVRCEVVGVASSTAGQLKNAADEYIDLASRIRELRLG